ncbi:hypothetical protein HMSSN036_13970 [Paenibacillus macerans]|nr:hypothetical protein HMSSN036_13970 [Paenibacillus macerans]
MEKEKISNIQLAFMMYLMVGGTSILVVPSFTAAQAKQDMWISPVLGSVFGLLIVWLTWSLHRMFPGETLIQYVQRVLGKTLGNAFIAVILFFQIDAIGLIVREYAEFTVQAFLSQTRSSLLSPALC